MALDHPEFPPNARLVLASSGGSDSLGALVRLHALLVDGTIGALSVVSVDHQLHPDSARWSALACAQARFFGVPAHVIPVTVPPQSEQGHRSLEARARLARYAALAEWMVCQRPDGVLVTAHHAEDQAETVLLAALRGSGAAGLAAMPTWTRFAHGWHWRPFLDVPRAQLRESAAQSGHAFVTDPSNADLRYDRNYLRSEILPRIQVRWPQAVERLDQTAAQAAEDMGLLIALAELDLGGPLDVTDLSITHLIELPRARLANLLRAWMRCRGALMAPRARLRVFIDQLQEAAPARLPTLAWGVWRITRYRDRLYWRELDRIPPAESVIWAEKGRPMMWSDTQSWRLVPTDASDPLAFDGRWLDQPWLLRMRQPQDRICTQALRPSRTLKNWFQARGVPPWVRETVVVIEINGQLAGLAGYGVDLAFRPTSGQDGWRVEGVTTAPVVKFVPDVDAD